MSLNTRRLIRIDVVLAPVSSGRRGFGTMLALGDSDVIDAVERVRTYIDLKSVIEDGFSITDPEYLAAALYFGQSPKPNELQIGRWIQAASAGSNKGGTTTSADQAALLAALLLITDATFDITVDLTDVSITVTEAMDLSGGVTLSGIAEIIQAELQLQETSTLCIWDGSRFVITSPTTGIDSLVSFATAEGTGTDISATIKMTSDLSLRLVPGFAVEEPVEAVTALAAISSVWYGGMFASDNIPTDDQLISVADYIEAATPSRIWGYTEIDSNVMEAGSNTNTIPYKLDAGGYQRASATYSSSDPYAIASAFGRAFSVNFAANRSTITLMYKQMPSIVAEDITNSQANALQDINCNVFVAYDNDTAIYQYGTMANGFYFDEVHGLDWLADAMQTEQFNLLFTSKTKIPQTDSGGTQIVNVANAVCIEAVNNGLVGPGQWNSDGFGTLEKGDFLQSGYYIFMPLMADQAQSTREQRIAPPYQVAVKLQGAIHEIDGIINVNR
jgi:hypothetical protein